MATILLAALGESPVVITSMVDKLAEEAGNTNIAPFDVLEILYSEEERVFSAYDRMVDALKTRYKLDPNMIPLSFSDANNLEYSYAFLRTLDERLKYHQKARNTVYLSLASGRKSTSALIALLAPLYPCVKKLYHILNKDADDDEFLTMGDLSKRSDANQLKAMFPEREKLTLVRIPYDEDQQASPSFLARLRTLTDEQLDALWELDQDEAESVSFALNPHLLSLEITPAAAKQYQQILRRDATHARGFANCFRKMRYPIMLIKHAEEGETGAHGKFPHKEGGQSLVFHFFKRRRSVERPFYHTESEDIYEHPELHAHKVIISRLEIERNGEYAPGKEIIKSLKFPLLENISLETIIKKEKSILLIPLGATPMIATQLYILLLKENYPIQQVVLLSPDPMKSDEIQQSCAMAQKAFKARGIPCELRSLSGYGDIDSPEACKAFQKKLEETIRHFQEHYPTHQIELALAGGRKAMAALTVFAAQNTGIRYVHHTLITNDALEQRVLAQTKLGILNDLHKDTLVSRLFLDAYKDERNTPNTDPFVTFKVPVIPSRKRTEKHPTSENKQA